MTTPQIHHHPKIINGCKSHFSKIRLYSGGSNKFLSREIAQSIGIDLSPINLKTFLDGEVYCKFEESVRGCDVYLIQSTCSPVNDNLMQLLIMIDACKRASAKSVNAVIPYFGYARSDRKTQSREAIAAKLTANLITTAGADRVIVMDLHSGQCIGYFDIPIDHVYGNKVIAEHIIEHYNCEDIVVVSPDIGGVSRARCFAKMLDDSPLAIVDKRRSAHNESTVMNVIGDVNGKTAILVDDIIDTAGTVTNAAQALRDKGAKNVIVCATHGVFSDPAIKRLSSGIFDEVIICNTIPVEPKKRFQQLTILSVGDTIGRHIMRVHNSNLSVQ